MNSFHFYPGYNLPVFFSLLQIEEKQRQIDFFYHFARLKRTAPLRRLQTPSNNIIDVESKSTHKITKTLSRV